MGRLAHGLPSSVGGVAQRKRSAAAHDITSSGGPATGHPRHPIGELERLEAVKGRWSRGRGRQANLLDADCYNSFRLDILSRPSNMVIIQACILLAPSPPQKPKPAWVNCWVLSRPRAPSKSRARGSQSCHPVRASGWRTLETLSSGNVANVGKAQAQVACRGPP